jgi:hypothetical protein
VCGAFSELSQRQTGGKFWTPNDELSTQLLYFEAFFFVASAVSRQPSPLQLLLFFSAA